MKIKLRVIIVSTYFAMSAIVLPHYAAAATESACKDDARLTKLHELLAQGQIPSAPFVVTANTFVQLHPKVRKALGKNLYICPSMPLTSKGDPMLSPITVPFHVLWSKIKHSIAENDWEELAFLQKNFRAEALPFEAIRSLVTLNFYNESTRKNVAETLNLITYDHNAIANRPEYRFFTSDIYHAFGGKIIAPMRVDYVNNKKALEKAHAIAQSENRKVNIWMYTGHDSSNAVRSLKRLGLEIVEIRY